MSKKQANLMIFLLFVIVILLLVIVWQNDQMYNMISNGHIGILSWLDSIQSNIYGLRSEIQVP